MLNTGKVTRFNENIEGFKSSIAMVDAVDRHYRDLVAQTRKSMESSPPINGPSYSSIPSTALIIEPRQIRQTCRDLIPASAAESHLNPLHNEFIDRITSLVWDTSGYGRRISGLERLRFRQQIRNEYILPWCNSVWPECNARDVYASIFADWRHARILIKDALSEEDTRELSDSVRQRRASGFQDSDVGAIAYVDHLLNGTIVGSYRHIVVDEAQDVSPIEFKLLSLNSTSNWFMILGDTVQRLTPCRGLR